MMKMKRIANSGILLQAAKQKENTTIKPDKTFMGRSKTEKC